MRKYLAGLAASLALVAGSTAAFAAEGYVTTNVNLRAGPSVTYPAVVVLPTGTPLEIVGCLEDTSWCDVDWDGNRGWIAAQYLEYSYRGRRVLLPEYAPSIGLPVVGFTFGDYWGRHYRGRSWYSTSDRWGGPPPHRPRPGRGDWGRPGGPGWDGRGSGWDGRDPDRPGRPPQGGHDWGRPGGDGRDGRGPDRPGRPPQGGQDWGRPGGDGRGPDRPGRPPQQGGNNRPPQGDHGRPPQQQDRRIPRGLTPSGAPQDSQ